MWMLSPFFQVLYCFLEFLLVVDIMIKFKVGVKDVQTKDVILDQRIIKARYINQGSFYSDVLNAFPCDIINYVFYDSLNNYLTNLTMIKIIRIPLFFKILKDIWLPRPIIDYLQRVPSIVRLIKILFLFFMILHVMSCFYWRTYIYVNDNYFDAEGLSDQEFDSLCDDKLNYLGANGTYRFCTVDTTTMWRPYEETVISVKQVRSTRRGA